MDATNDPGLRSWLAVDDDSDFPIQNLPFGMFTTANNELPRAGVAIGNQIVDLLAVHRSGVVSFPDEKMLRGSLNQLFAFGVGPVRRRISELLSSGNKELSNVPNRGIVGMAAATMHMPFAVGDYVDFYSSEQHATNVGRMFRPDDPPLLPNWKHIPIGYHGRASTVVVSGTPIVRPTGQRPGPDGPTFGPSEKLDIELEVGFFTGTPTELGQTIPVDVAQSYIGGVVLVNDWSARDIQAWEYRPLGPFLGKSFATTTSPWVVTMDALAPFMVEAPEQDPAPLPYLAAQPNLALDLNLRVELNGTVIAETGFSDMYWSMAQQLAHVASNGTAVRVGDLYASGTVSGQERSQFGSMLELSWNGSQPISLADGSERTFLDDGDTVRISGWCQPDHGPRIGFGDCVGTIVPAVAG
ncbi:MAG: fumarylacetoacetase [Acidimicrobiia bacterium]|nr:fumarylacetoacetase [Acidimicrobiia bacterium]